MMFSAHNFPIRDSYQSIGTYVESILSLPLKILYFLLKDGLHSEIYREVESYFESVQ